VLALGVTPVAVREWFEERPYATWVWAQDELGDAEPEVLSSTELNFERITALEPDLILGVTSGITRDEYETLSEIAPTVGQSGAYVDYGVPWQEEATRTTGRALGRERRAEEDVSEVEGRFQETRAEHQEFENATGVVALYGENGSFSAYGPEDTRGRFMSALGFELPDEIAELAGDQFYAEISAPSGSNC
jgi:iron complex transport system substrate-binding protein